MPQRSQSESVNLGQPPYPDWSDEMDHTGRAFADHMAPFDRDDQPSLVGTDVAAGRVREAGSGAARAARAVGEAIAERVGATGSAAVERASAMVDEAARSARSMADDLESFARRQPLSALAAALLIGVALGMFSRRGARP